MSNTILLNLSNHYNASQRLHIEIDEKDNYIYSTVVDCLPLEDATPHRPPRFGVEESSAHRFTVRESEHRTVPPR